MYIVQCTAYAYNGRHHMI